MSAVKIIGAGFSGLTLARELVLRGLQVEVWDTARRTGGLIHSEARPDGLVETAANALLCNTEIEKLFEELSLEWASPGSQRQRRYVYVNGQCRRWPIGIRSSFKALSFVFKKWRKSTDILPKTDESMREWSDRVFTPEISDSLLAPALQGIYAGNFDNMSAELVTKNWFHANVTRGVRRGSHAPRGGMQNLIQALEQDLRQSGVEFKLGQELSFEQAGTPVILCTSGWAASEWLKGGANELAQQLSQVEPLPLITTTCFFEPSSGDLHGFGCLFAKKESLNHLGVLFNAEIFTERSRQRSETWIMGGALYKNKLELNDDEVLQSILEDRKKIWGLTAHPLDFKITRWTRALPHYTVDWARTLKELKVPPGIYLHGNYLGAIGLAQIYHRSKELAEEVFKQHG